MTQQYTKRRQHVVRYHSKLADGVTTLGHNNPNPGTLEKAQ